MKTQITSAVILASALSFVGLASAYAQTQAAAPPPPAVSHGPVVPGVCIVSIDGAMGTSTVGKYVQTRIQQIGTQVQSELSAEQSAIATEAKALDGQRGTLDQAAIDQKTAALQLRANALQRKAQLREREMQATQQKAIGRIGQEMEPIIRASYQQSKCSLLLQRDAVILANPAMDITQSVVAGLNVKITQFTFDRERLDQAAAGGQTAN
ncbi:MAG: outer membrane chaperone Skp [Phenylobacterium zucineum]|nr:MAG: outer membrane chaperone Skp [Phenylobacterium zucineum]